MVASQGVFVCVWFGVLLGVCLKIVLEPKTVWSLALTQSYIITKLQ